VLAYLGDRLGIYRAMAGAGPLTSGQLAGRTGLAERYLREWLAAQAAGGYLTYHPDGERFELPDEHAAVLAVEESPANVMGGFEVIAALWAGADRLGRAFRSGEGIGWDEHDPRLYRGVERFYAAGYRANLVVAWLPALDGVVAKLEHGASVLDVGCGHGAAVILMAKAFPASRFVGVDSHPASIEQARKAAADAGVADRVRFEPADAAGYGNAGAEAGHDLVCFFDTLHDLGDPVGAAAHARAALAQEGTLMLVEPRAGDRLADNLHPLGRVFYAASTQLCTPNALSQQDRPGAQALGAQAGPARLREVLEAAGFTRVRVAAETPVNLVLEAKP
jgi:SAM-dependent methyltransferase